METKSIGLVMVAMLLGATLAWADDGPARAQPNGRLFLMPGAGATQPAGGANGATPAPVAEVPLAPVPAVVPAPAGPAPCTSCKGSNGCGYRRKWYDQSLIDWLLYYPPSRQEWLCACQRRCTPCCTPPLYTYFLRNCVGPDCPEGCRDRGAGCGKGCKSGCGAGCNGSAP
jgi:hypothetical protein